MKCFNCRADLPDGYYDPENMRRACTPDSRIVRVAKRCPNCDCVLEIEEVTTPAPYKPPMKLKDAATPHSG